MPSKALASARYALRGIGFMLGERNVQVLAVSTALLAVAGIHFGLSALEWCALIGSTTLVWVAEALNTALERLTDLASPDFHPLAGKAKDIAAGAVLLAVLGAVSTGLVVFGPRLL